MGDPGPHPERSAGAQGPRRPNCGGPAKRLALYLHTGRGAMIKSGCIFALLAAALAASPPAGAAGALAVGSTSDVSKDGIAVGTSINYDTAEEARAAALKRCREYKPAPKAAAMCQSVGTFKSECYAVSFDPKPGRLGDRIHQGAGGGAGARELQSHRGRQPTRLLPDRRIEMRRKVKPRGHAF